MGFSSSGSAVADTVGCSVVDGCSDKLLSGSVLYASLFASSDSLVSDATTLSFVSSAVDVAYWTCFRSLISSIMALFVSMVFGLGISTFVSSNFFSSDAAFSGVCLDGDSSAFCCGFFLSLISTLNSN